MPTARTQPGPPAQARSTPAHATRPGPQLVPYVRAYTFSDDELRGELYRPLPARSDCFLQFYLGDRYRIRNVSSGATHLTARSVLIGPHSRRREDLLLTGHLRTFTIHLRPAGFRALFGIPAPHIADYANPADAVLGHTLTRLEDRLAGAPPQEMPDIAEAFLLHHLARTRPAPRHDLVHQLARALTRPCLSIGTLSVRHNLSPRQVERLFLEYTGQSPQLFSRLARLNQALNLSRSGADWSTIALEAGYFDQSHMIREFRSLNGVTPLQFAALTMQTQP